jgi:hypothetical protein
MNAIFAASFAVFIAPSFSTGKHSPLNLRRINAPIAAGAAPDTSTRADIDVLVKLRER